MFPFGTVDRPLGVWRVAGFDNSRPGGHVLAKVRIYALARSLGLSSRETIERLARVHGIDVAGASSTVDDVIARRFADELRGDAGQSSGAAPDEREPARTVTDTTAPGSADPPGRPDDATDPSSAQLAPASAIARAPAASSTEPGPSPSPPDDLAAERPARSADRPRVGMLAGLLPLRTIDRYVIREVASPFLLGLLVFTFILEIPPLMQVAEKLIAKGVPSGDIVRIMVTLLPQALGVTIPMALLLGLLIGLSRLSSDRETVAFQACGVSIYRLIRPIGVVAAVAWAATSYIMIVALPDANQTFREITYNIIASRAEREVKPRVFFEDFPNMVLYVQDVPADSSGWRGVFMADIQRSTPDVYVAHQGRIFLDRDASRVEMTLLDGVRHRLSEQGPHEYEVLEFDRMTLSLDPETVFPRGGPQRGDPERTIAQLQVEVDQLRSQGLSPHAPIMAIHRKFSIPVACLVFGIIGLALGVTSRKDGKLASFVLGIGVIFAYYVIMYIGEAMAKGQLVSPHLAMWLPNILLGMAGILMMLWRAKSSELRLALPFLRRDRPDDAGASSPAESEPTASDHSTPPTAVPRASAGATRSRLPLLRTQILDRYVTLLYLKIVALGFAGMLGIFYIAGFIDLSDKLFKGQTTGWTLLQYFWYATPQFIYYVLPIATLVATLVTIGLLTKTSELVVMKACGISLYRVAAPVLIFGAVWSVCLFGLEETVMARSNQRAEAIRHEIRSGTPKMLDILNRKWLVGRDGRIYNYAFFDRQRAELNGVSVYELDDTTWRLMRRTFSTQAAFQDGWEARDGWVRQFGPPPSEGFETFDAEAVDFEPPDYFASERPDAELMTYDQLEGYIDSLQASGFNVVPYLVELHRKLSFPVVTIVMTLIAVPFAVTTGSRGAMYGVGLGLTLAISYWIILSVFAAIGSAGLLSPLLAAWAPNIGFSAGAAYLLLSVRT